MKPTDYLNNDEALRQAMLQKAERRSTECPVPSDLEARVMQRLEARGTQVAASTGKGHNKVKHLVRRLLPLAAAAAVVLVALMLPQQFRETARQPEPLPQIAKADTARTQQPRKDSDHEQEPDEVVKEIERLKYETPKHLMAANTPKPKLQKVADTQKSEHPTAANTAKPELQRAANMPTPEQMLMKAEPAMQLEERTQQTSAVGSIDDDDQPQGIAEFYANLSIEEYLAAMARKEEAEVKAIRERGKQLERSMMANSPGMY